MRIAALAIVIPIVVDRLVTRPAQAATPGCTTQACGFRDAFTDIAALGYKVYGLSKDKPDAQQKVGSGPPSSPQTASFLPNSHDLS